MTKYIKTGTTEFEQFDEIKWNKIYHDCSDPDEWEAKASKLGVDRYHGYFIIPTKEGDMRIYDGDWIATGINGEHWPVKDEIFQKTYKKLPVIPKALAKWIETCKRAGTPLLMILDDTLSVEDLTQDDTDQIEDWMDTHTDNEVSNIISRAWLDGYEVEEVE
ncbi:MAG: DUF1642 domain-containing protein [Lactobacillus sp.]|nr:MAG: DUF1642 domain-containing protein [Lactobacillus sp.]